MSAGAQAVHEEGDGWLFLVGGSNRVREQYRDDLAARWRLWRWRRLVQRRAARSARLGIRYVHAVVPEKVTVYADRFPGLGIDWRLSPARRLSALTGAPGVVDLVAALRAERDRAPLYFLTDTHWTHQGCAAAYRAICRACGVVPRDDLEDRAFVETTMVRDLGEKLDPPRTELVRHYDFLREGARVEAGRLLAAYESAGAIQSLHVGADAVFRNPRAPARQRVMLFGDSCAHFAPFMLTGMIAETFAETRFVWSSSLDWGLVERARPDILIYQMAERFMARVPRDRFDLEAFATRRLAQLAGGPGRPA